MRVKFLGGIKLACNQENGAKIMLFSLVYLMFVIFTGVMYLVYEILRSRTLNKVIDVFVRYANFLVPISIFILLILIYIWYNGYISFFVTTGTLPIPNISVVMSDLSLRHQVIAILIFPVVFFAVFGYIAKLFILAFIKIIIRAKKLLDLSRIWAFVKIIIQPQKSLDLLRGMLRSIRSLLVHFKLIMDIVGTVAVISSFLWQIGFGPFSIGISILIMAPDALYLIYKDNYLSKDKYFSWGLSLLLSYIFLCFGCVVYLCCIASGPQPGRLFGVSVS